jgi:hypothetical protein
MLKCSRATAVMLLVVTLGTVVALPVASTTAAARIVSPPEQDPGTVITVVTTGLEIAGKFKSLFGKNPDSGTRQRLDDIRAQNTTIIRQLGQVLDVLAGLGVTIRAGVRDELHRHLRETLTSHTQVFYEIWAGETTPQAYRQATYRYRDEILPVIRPLGRQLASPESYGYAHFGMVGETMSIEMWISRRIDEAATIRREHARTYLTYFDRVVSPTEPGSVGAQLAAAQGQVARMDAVLAQADSFVRITPSSIVQRNAVRRRYSRGTCDYEQRANLQRTITGNSNTRFSHSDSWVNVADVRVGCYRDPGPPGGPHGRLRLLGASPFGLMRDSTFIPQPDPVLRDLSPASRVEYWNAAIEIRKRARDEVRALEITRNTAELFRQMAQEEVENPW